MPETRILVVDDNPTNLKLICDLLDGFGYQVPKAMDAEQALDLTRRWSPDLILRDLA